MDKPEIPEINPEQVMMCAKVLILACLSTDADTMAVTQEGFSKDGYVFGNYKVTVEKTT